MWGRAEGLQLMRMSLDSNTEIAGCGGFMETWRTDIMSLLDRYLRGELTVDSFTSAYEHWWNFERVAAEQTREETARLEALFDVVAHYSPVPGDRAAWKGFKDEQAVTSAVRELRDWITNTTGS